MSQLSYIRYKYCACCSVRLDKTKKVNLRRATEYDVATLNTAKTITPTNKRKVIDNISINVGDYLCGYCKNYAQKLK